MKRYLILIIQLFIALVISAQTNIRYTSANLNLRFAPNTSSKIITVIPKGTEVRMTDDCTCEWLPVSYSEDTGYVYSKYLTREKIGYEKASVSSSRSTKLKYYINSDGERVQSPTYYNSVPAGATALCRDGTYSFSRNRRGTCSHHGGVSKWL